ncbi:hypothetical protein [uncultured Amnibacterium sp.]
MPDPDPPSPTCGWCHVPLQAMGDATMPYWVCPQCDEVSIDVRHA